MNQAARQAADAWDPARDEAAGDQCKAYSVTALAQAPPATGQSAPGFDISGY